MRVAEEREKRRERRREKATRSDRASDSLKAHGPAFFTLPMVTFVTIRQLSDTKLCSQL